MTTREVLLEGDAPWGFRMHGGVDQNQPLRISRVNPGSKASHRGIREGDFISSINGQSTKTLTNTEAHGLLRNSGDVLKLGLNEDPDGSPKRRQYRTVHHQESFQETVKKSSITTYSSVKTVEDIDSPSDRDNELIKERNGQTSINGTSTIPPSNLLLTKKPSSSSSSSPTLTKEDLRTLSSDNALASQRSSYTNCTLSPSSPSILSEDGICSYAPGPQLLEDKHDAIIDNMNDSKSSSRSKKRRQRRKNRKIESNSNDDSTRDNTDTDKAFPDEYTVQSPIELSKENNDKKPNKPVKSRSLDDDDMFKIQEVSEHTESEDKDKETQAIVSEASESEVDWEETETLDTPKPIHGSLSTLTLPLEGCITEQITLMSPEEEKTLRDFLVGLNLVNGPEEAANQVLDKSESLKDKKAKKKAELEKYFFPIYQNPRYLDVISEESRESSDRESDRESKTSLTRVLRKGTPEIPITPPKVPPRPNRRKILHKSAPPIDQPQAILVDTKIIEPIQPICSIVPATASNVEIVYLTSSETDSADELESNSSDSYAIPSEKDSSNEDLSEKTLINDKTDDETVNIRNAQYTHKSDKISNESFEEINKPNETDTTIFSSTTSFSVKSSKHFTDKEDDMLNQLLTPPTTPDNSSPNDTKGSVTTDLDSLIKVEPEIYTNVLTPPPPSRSPSSSRSSSRSSSLCTAKYNPSTSSITDVIALIKEPEEGKYFQALTLREICLQFLLALPFGRDILEELADVSKYIESYTRSLPSTVLPKLVPNIAQFVNRSHTNSNNVSYDLSVQLPTKKRQEDITCVKIVPKDVASGFQHTAVKDAVPGDYNSTMQHRIPIEIESENKVNRVVELPITFDPNSKKNLIQEIIIPIKIEAGIGPINVATGHDKGIKIPILLKEEIENKPKEITIPVRKESLNQKLKEYERKEDKVVESTQSTRIIDDKGKEVIIPIRIDSLKAKTKEYIIPIKKEIKTNEKPVETNKHSRIIGDEGKEVVIPIRIESLNRKVKECLIPIKKEIKTNKETVQVNKSFTEVVDEEEKEVIIPIRKESLNTKAEEHIIPITKEVKSNETTLETENSTKIEDRRKEVTIPIRKESLNTKAEEYTIPIRKEIKSNETTVETTKNSTRIEDRRKEVRIPTRKESLHTEAEEHIIPIRKEVKSNETTIETTKNSTIIEDRRKEVTNLIRKESLNNKAEEHIIPIRKEVKSNETTVETTKNSTRIEDRRKEVRIPTRKESLHTEAEEHIIPIRKEVKSNETTIETTKNSTIIEDRRKEVTNLIRKESLNNKAEEHIIPIRKEVKSNETTVETSKNSTRIEDKRKEVTIPIRKESLNIKPKEYIIAIKKNAAVSEDRDKEYVIPITKEIGIEEKDHKYISKEVEINNETTTKSELTSKCADSDTMKHREVKIPIIKEWSGLPTERDPKLLLCLSPKQKDELDKTKQVPDEAAQLIDLHEKFINRKTSHEEIKKEMENSVTIMNCGQQPCNRLLTIIKEEPTSSIGDTNYLYFVEKDTTMFEKNFTLPRMMDNPRLHAKDLSEWLNLARNKSMSESNLTTAADIPENNLRNNFNIQHATPTRRTSLPHDIFEKQMIYIQEKEREIQRQLEALEEEKRLLNAEMAPSKEFQVEDYYYSRRGDFAESRKRPTSMPLMPTEYFRQQMYEEYMDKFAEREERKQHKIIKVTSSKDLNQESVPVDRKEILHPIQLEDEFMDKVKEMQDIGKLEKVAKSVEKEIGSSNADADVPPVLVMDGEELKVVKELPKHLQEFVDDEGIWSPGQKIDLSPKEREKRGYEIQQDESLPPVWTPKSANSSPVAERKEFRSVNFQSPVLGRRNRTTSENLSSQPQSQAPPWKIPDYSSDTGSASSFLERRLPTSRSTPASSGFSDFSSASRLPKAQNPTITLLQKAREGQLPKGALYIDQEQRQYRPRDDRPPIVGPGEVLYQIKNEYTSESDNERSRKMTDLGPRKFEGIGPVTKEGIPLVLRSEVKDQNQSKWYKRMYDTIHKQKPHNDEYVTIRYKQKRAQYPYTSGYLSEPEPGAYDSDFTDYKYQTLDRRRPPPQDRSSDYVSSTMPRPTVNRSSSSDIVRTTQDYYRSPGKIENYTPGHSSIAEKEAKQWWDEVMDIFDGHLEQQKKVQPQVHPRSFINQCLKDTGYESDSTLVFRRREEAAQQQLSPKEQREAYKVIQKGGDVPLHGLRKLAPEKPKEPEPPVPPPKGQYARNLNQESPRKYVENEVTIHYKTPVRQEIKDYLSEDELAHRQAETMKKIYQEERRKKYLQELQDMNSRRHTDNFIPSQKSPISLNRYDDFDDLAPNARPRPRSPEHRLCARALYNFVGQSARELTFRKGDIIYLRRQIDKNWYEGELNAMVGLFPANYVEIIPFEGTKTKSTLRKAHEGQARAKYNFVAQTHLELSLAKGELVVVTRKIDDNWFEGKIGGRKGIFPANYVDILIDPQSPAPPSSKPVAAPASHSLLLNGSAGGKESMGSHSYRPSLPSAPQLTSSYHAKPVNVLNTGSHNGKIPGLSQALHIETQSEPVPYRAMYKYKPQNEDELELLEGDTVFVLEKCDDGWYVGSSERTGAFGTFPGNYVEKI